MTDGKLEQIRREQILCAEQIIKAIALLASDTNGAKLHRDKLFDDLVKGLPSP